MRLRNIIAAATLAMIGTGSLVAAPATPIPRKGEKRVARTGSSRNGGGATAWKRTPVTPLDHQRLEAAAFKRWRKGGRLARIVAAGGALALGA